MYRFWTPSPNLAIHTFIGILGLNMCDFVQQTGLRHSFINGLDSLSHMIGKWSPNMLFVVLHRMLLLCCRSTRSPGFGDLSDTEACHQYSCNAERLPRLLFSYFQGCPDDGQVESQRLLFVGWRCYTQCLCFAIKAPGVLALGTLLILRLVISSYWMRKGCPDCFSYIFRVVQILKAMWGSKFKLSDVMKYLSFNYSNW